MTLDAKIEALLFFKGEPVKVTKLATFLKASEKEIKEALRVLEENLESRGLQLVFKEKENEVMLGTHKDLSSLLESIQKEELNKDLSKPALETLSIILYKDGVTRGDIDYIRGVNGSFMLRNLLIRGLVERTVHPTDSRKYIYKPTFELLSYLGLSRIEELPEYESIRQNLDESTIQEEGYEKDEKHQD